MGLDITALDYSTAHYGTPYSGFHRTRTAIAKAVGIDLEKMVGFQYPPDADTKGIEWDAVPAEAKGLVPLLHHSDCDGYMSRYECEQVADALALVVDRVDEAERTNARDLMDMMRVAGEGAGALFH